MLDNVDGLPARAREIARHTQLINDLVRLEALGADGELSSEQRDRLRNVRNVLGNLGIDNDTSRSSDGSAPAATLADAARRHAGPQLSLRVRAIPADQGRGTGLVGVARAAL